MTHQEDIGILNMGASNMSALDFIKTNTIRCKVTYQPQHNSTGLLQYHTSTIDRPSQGEKYVSMINNIIHQGEPLWTISSRGVGWTFSSAEHMIGHVEILSTCELIPCILTTVE